MTELLKFGCALTANGSLIQGNALNRHDEDLNLSHENIWA
jgi:hypothetical protein